MSLNLANAITRFVNSTLAAADVDLERAWVWGDYDEGLRFALFLTYQQLRELSVAIAARRLSAGLPVTQAQHILGQYHQAYRDLDAVLLGMDDLTAAGEPAPGEWSLSATLLHILRAARSFFAVCVYAQERNNSSEKRPLEMSDAEWDAFWSGDNFTHIAESGSFSELYAYWQGLHQRVLNTFLNTTDADLEAPSVFWESTPMPLRFRLHRFDAHLRQHTIQMEKALLLLGVEVTETRRLWRLIFSALAEVESLCLGVSNLGSELCEQQAEEIDTRSGEIEAILQGEYHARPPD